jgi:hypothetical protein
MVLRSAYSNVASLQEGTAIRSGNSYVATVSHFSGWCIADTISTFKGADLIELNSDRIWISGDGSVFATLPSNGSGSLELHDALSGATTRTLPLPGFCNIQLSRDASFVFDACDTRQTLFDGKSGDVLHEYYVPNAQSGMSSIAMIGDSGMGILASENDTQPVMLNLKDSTVVKRLSYTYGGAKPRPTIAATSFDEDYMLLQSVGAATSYTLYDNGKDQQVNTVQPRSNTKFNLASPDLSIVAVTQNDGKGAWFYDTRTGEQLNTEIFPSTDFAFIDNEQIVARKGPAVFPGVYSIRSGALLEALWNGPPPPEGLSHFVSSIDGSIVAAVHPSTTAGKMKVWIARRK